MDRLVKNSVAFMWTMFATALLFKWKKLESLSSSVPDDSVWGLAPSG